MITIRRYLLLAAVFGAGALLAGIPRRAVEAVPVPDAPLNPQAPKAAEHIELAPGDNPLVDRHLHLLQSRNARDRLAAHKYLKEHQQWLIESLMAIAKPGEDRHRRDNAHSRRQAVELLAAFPQRDLVRFLVQNVDYHNPRLVSHDLSMLDGFPCALALRNFGQSATADVLLYLRMVAQTDGVSETAMQLYAWFFLETFGPNEGGEEEAIHVVERAALRSGPIYGKQTRRLLATLKEISTKRRLRSPMDPVPIPAPRDE